MERWLNKKCSKYSDDLNKDLIENLFQELLSFLKKNDDIYLEEDFETFKKDFYNFIYNQYS
jgi:hypothetical protein|tara:strand:+ start:63 stop:245 length:183 start_codon:yes stop_codon:yes gene_type:complete